MYSRYSMNRRMPLSLWARNPDGGCGPGRTVSRAEAGICIERVFDCSRSGDARGVGAGGGGTWTQGSLGAVLRQREWGWQADWS